MTHRNAARLKRALGPALKADLVQSADADGAGMTVPQLATMLDKSPEWVYAVQRGEIALNVWHLIEWAQATGGTHAIQLLCEACGGQFIPTPGDGDATVGEIAAVITSHAEFISDMASTYRDGRVDRREALRADEVREKCDGLVRAAVALMAKYNADAERARNGRVTRLSEAI